jgi:hypothetical protein
MSMFQDAYRGRLAAGRATAGQNIYRRNAQYGLNARRADLQTNEMAENQALQNKNRAYSVYGQAGQLATNAYQNQLANSGAFRNFAFGALTGLMR